MITYVVVLVPHEVKSLAAVFLPHHGYLIWDGIDGEYRVYAVTKPASSSDDHVFRDVDGTLLGALRHFSSLELAQAWAEDDDEARKRMRRVS